MDDAQAVAEEQVRGPETPEDVAILYSWANLPGAKYRDFSASRREYRAQQRARVAEEQRQAELAAARELKQAAQKEIEEAQRQLEDSRKREAQAAADAEAKSSAEEAFRLAEEKAAQEGQEVQRREQSAEELRKLAERARAEMLEARKRAEEQAARYAEADAQYRAQIAAQKAIVPGEVSDPYYYTGQVDPAYFALTPGVRTAQAARVSTERKAYVYPMHPGSDEHDSGTLTSYRSSTTFAPSPNVLGPVPGVTPAPSSGPVYHQTSVSLNEDLLERAQPSEHDRSRPLQFAGYAGGSGGDDDGSGLDDRYYDGEPPPPKFTPSPGRSQQAGSEPPASSLHIRPAVRASGADHVAHRPIIRPARAQGDPRRGDQREVTPAVSALPSRFQEQPPEQSAPGRLAPLSYDADDDYDEGRSSRMFIPSPRRRVLNPPAPQGRPMDVHGLQPLGPRPLEPVDSPRIADVARGRQDAFILQGEREAAAATDGVTGSQIQGADKAGISAVTTPTSVPPVAHTSARGSGERAKWRSLNRSADNRARTTRQPRLQTEAHPVPQADDSFSRPPAWLSAERPAVTTMRPDEISRTGNPSGDDASSVEDGTREIGLLRRAPLEIRTATTGATRGRETETSQALPAAHPQDSVAAENAAVLEQTGFPDDTHQRAALGQRRPEPPATPDTLQQSRERVASRWFALNGLVGAPGAYDLRDPIRQIEVQTPSLAVMSLSGGVGRTSIVATLGRALSSAGEKVLLADTNVHGILPYYFGARDLRPGTVRTFTPPPGSTDAPVLLVNYETDGLSQDEAGQKRLLDDLARRSRGTQRVLLDLNSSSTWIARRLAHVSPYVLVPVAPDMNSVLGTRTVEKLFADIVDPEGRPVKPYYVLNQYDPTLPLHLDVREVLRQILGDRLLPIMLHRTPAVSEALAEGMTVIDYAPGSPVSEDYMNLAAWVRNLAAAGTGPARGARWSER